jgi:hypothetical protein
METPTPVNLAALGNILAKSKQVMNQVEAKNPVKQSRTSSVTEGYVSGPIYDESDERDFDNTLEYGTQLPHVGQSPAFDPTTTNLDYTDEQVMNSNLPQAVKEAMIKNKIPKLMTPPPKFTAEDISRITGAPLKQQVQPKPQMLNETMIPKQNSDMITISKSELKEMINEGISTFFKQVYDKTLTEETIKKTINLLIKEGKISVKKKTS